MTLCIYLYICIQPCTEEELILLGSSAKTQTLADLLPITHFYVICEWVGGYTYTPDTYTVAVVRGVQASGSRHIQQESSIVTRD